MAERTFFQTLAHVVGDFFAFTAELLGRTDTRNALIRDLGGDPNRVTSVRELPEDKLAAIQAYRDSVSDDLEADAQLVLDIAAVLDAIIANVEVWAEAFPELDDAPLEAVEDIMDELGTSLLDLAASSWIRHRAPRLFLLMEALAVVDEVVSTYGPGDGVGGRFGRSGKVIFDFLFQPGKTFRSLDLGRDWSGSIGEVTVDAAFRLGGASVGFWDGFKGIDGIADVYVGWDSPALSIESTDQPTTADLVSSHMVSLAFGQDATPKDGPTTEENLQFTLMYVPTGAPGGPGVFVAMGGALSIDDKIGEKWLLTGRLRSDAGVAGLFGFGHSDFSAGVDDLHQGVGLSSVPDPSSAISFSVPRPTRTRLDIGQLSFTFELGVDGVTVKGSMLQSVFVLDRSSFDSFLKRLLPKDPVRVPFSVTLGYSTERGLILEGTVLPSPGTAGPGVRNSPLAGDRDLDTPIISATLPLGKRLGPVTIHEIALRLSRGRPDAPGGTDVVAVEADLSFSAQLGPVYFRLDQVGLSLVLDTSKSTSDSNLRWVDAHLDANPPLGIAVQVDTASVSGGGVLFHDPTQGVYFGALALRFAGVGTLKAIGLVSTRGADGSDACSFIIIATLEGRLLQIGPVTIEGFGLLYASDRTFDEAAMRAALPTGQLRNVLFPVDPVHHTAETQRSLDTFFPARQDSYLFGLLVRMSFGSGHLIRLDLALILQWGSSVSNRLVILGRLSSLLPDEAAPLIKLNLDAVGIFDPSEGVAALDAVLVDSKLCGRFALTGSAAFRRTPGAGGFALAVGGFHPSFRAPDGFPTLRRITVALTVGDNPKLICEAYLAITSNTIQIGASATLYASACGFSIDGNVGFDVLIEPLRFHYLAEFRASVQLKRGSRSLIKVSVSGALEGSLPLQARGKASFEILWCDFSVGFDKTLVGGSSDRALPLVDVLDAVLQQLSDPRHWTAAEPAGALAMVSVRAEPRAGEAVLVHPMGNLTVRQGAAPLNLGRDIDRVGAAAPSGSRRFTITRVLVGDEEQRTHAVRDLFAPAEYFDLTDDEKLAAPSFEEMDAGLAFGDQDYRFDDSRKVGSPFDYTDIVIGEDGTATVEPEPHTVDGSLVLRLLQLGAAALAPTRRGVSVRFDSTARDEVPTLRERGWVVAEAGNETVSALAPTWIEAKALVDLAGPDALGHPVLVPASELTG
jgi:hypothetical protein